jgi:alkylated DNA repair dioxygenase AlkB
MTTCLLDRNGEQLIYHARVFSNQWFNILNREVEWRQNSIRIFGNVLPEPRLTAWYGLEYRYSNIQWPEREFPSFLIPLKEEVERHCNFEFNSVLLNLYRDGQDSMGWHRDNEPEMDQSVIASVSFGASRKFKLKERKGTEKMDVLLESGSLLIMNDLQENWLHAIPKTKLCASPRINLTFRRIMR